MAVKKTSKKKEESATPAKAEAKEPAPKKTAKKAAAPKASSEPAAPTPAAAPASESKSKVAPKKGAAKKAAAPVKLSASQDELLKKIGGATDAGYTLEKKAEQRSIDSLLEKKLIKKGAKDKASGVIRYHISSSGKKHIS